MFALSPVLGVSQGFGSQIIDLLEDRLIHPSDGLAPQYAMLDKYQRGEDLGPISWMPLESLTPEILNLEEVRNSGFRSIDFPVYLGKPSVQKTIMVCAMDPLCNDDHPGLIGGWVPFSILKQPADFRGSDRSNHAFFQPLREQFNLYITDIYKLYFKYGAKKSNQLSAYTKLKVHREILQEEIRIIQPDSIVTLGNAAKNALAQLLNAEQQGSHQIIHRINTYQWDENCRIYHLPHISGLAGGAKKKLLQDAYVPGKMLNEQLAYYLIELLRQSPRG